MILGSVWCSVFGVRCSVFGVRCSVFGQASRGRESAGGCYCSSGFPARDLPFCDWSAWRSLVGGAGRLVASREAAKRIYRALVRLSWRFLGTAHER